MIRRLATMLMMLGANSCLFAATFSEANALYEKGKFKEAIGAYQSLLKEHTNGASPHLLFNLGNACFKNGQPGFAIANYRRAAALAPRDPDIQANLRFARDSITATYQEPPYTRLLTYFRFPELALVTMIVWWVFLSLATIGVLSPALRQRLRPLIRTAGGMFAVTFFYTVLVYFHSEQRTAVFLRESPVRLGPLEESQTAFTLREGAELRVLGRRENWVQVGDNSRQGWVPQNAVAAVP